MTKIAETFSYKGLPYPDEDSVLASDSYDETRIVGLDGVRDIAVEIDEHNEKIRPKIEKAKLGNRALTGVAIALGIDGIRRAAAGDTDAIATIEGAASILSSFVNIGVHGYRKKKEGELIPKTDAPFIAHELVRKD